MGPTVVLGVGNLIQSDEGVGVRCVQKLEAEGLLPAGVRAIDGGTSTHELLEDLENLDLLVIVDAIAAEPPGQIFRLEGAAIPSAFSNKLSPHQHGINDLLAKLVFLGRAPRRVVLLGVAPASLALGDVLSPAIAATLPELCRRVLAEVTPAQT